MSFPSMNAKSLTAYVMGKPVGTASTTVSVHMELPTLSFGYVIAEVPAVVDVSGMEFGIHVAVAAGTVVPQNTTIASGASTVELVFADLGASGTQLATVNSLTNPDDFSNTVAGGWTSNLVRTGVGTGTVDLDADDVFGLQVVANLTTVDGFGVVGVNINYIYGKPAVIN